MEKSKLSSLLNSCTQFAPSTQAPPWSLLLRIHELELEESPSAHPLLRLLAELRAEPELQTFAGKMQVFGTSARRVELRDIVAWLVQRAAAFGADRALDDLSHYLQAKEITYAVVTAVGGIRIEEPIQLTEGLTLISWGAVHESRTKQSITERFVLHSGYHFPEAAIVGATTLPVLHLEAGDGMSVRQVVDYGRVEDILLCLGLLGPAAPTPLGSWIEPPEWAPIFSAGYSVPLVEGLGLPRSLPSDAAARFQALYSRWTGIGEPLRNELRIPMQRLNSAIRRATQVDAAIDLGIVLEALFLRDGGEQGELTFRLRVRGARWLGTTLEDRRALWKLLGDLYTLRSKAVHRGVLSSSDGGVKMRTRLEAGFRVAASAIERIILVGAPNWEEVTLS